MNWEYMVERWERLMSSGGTGPLQERLKLHGRARWELVSATVEDEAHLLLVFKRPVE